MSFSWTEVFGLANDGYNCGKQPVEIYLAVITAVNPLTLDLGNNKPITNEFIQCCSRVQYLKNTADENEVGQRVVVIKALGGQLFFVADKAEEKDILGTSIAKIADVNPIKLKLCNGKIYKDNMLVFVKELSGLKETTDKSEIGEKLLVNRSYYEDKIYVLNRVGDD